MERVTVTIYTDPGCPFGFNAQRQEAQLAWHYGHGVDIARRMIVLSERSASFEERGLSREMIAGSYQRLQATYGMPMVAQAPHRLAATIDACRLYVGARIDDPSRADPLLRALRRRIFSDGGSADEIETLRGAGSDTGIATDTLDAWLRDPRIEQALRNDMAAARSPSREALALAHRLSGSADERRYSTASAVFELGERRIVMPGFQPFAVYEVAMANVAPDVERRPPPSNVEELLSWARWPLATAEVAELRGIGLDQARAELEEAGARLSAAAQDGYWSRA